MAKTTNWKYPTKKTAKAVKEMSTKLSFPKYALFVFWENNKKYDKARVVASYD